MPPRSRRRQRWLPGKAATQGGLSVRRGKQRNPARRFESGTLRVCKRCKIKNDPPRVAYDDSMLRLFAYCTECGAAIGEVPRTNEWAEVQWNQRFVR